MSKKPYYITTAIAYTSGKPHIGNTYEFVLADAIARFKRKKYGIHISPEVLVKGSCSSSRSYVILAE